MIPAYHLKDDIAAVLQSVLVQTFQDVEIGSSDELASIIPTAFARITDCSTSIERNLRDASWERANGFYKAGICRNTEGDALFFVTRPFTSRLLWGNAGADYFLTSRLNYLPEFSRIREKPSAYAFRNASTFYA